MSVLLEPQQTQKQFKYLIHSDEKDAVVKYTQTVSVALCTYNGETYLQAQMDAICSQTYPNLEIIVVDDSSTDHTMAILRAYQLKDTRIKIFENERNLGFVRNFSRALSLCTGQFIALADQDDIWSLTKIETFMREIKENALIYSDAILIDSTGRLMNQYLIAPHKNLVRGRCDQAFIFANCVSGNTLMFRSELLKFILPIPNVSFHDTWIAFVAASMGTITYTPLAQTYYRRHAAQVTCNTIKKDIRYTLGFFRRKAQLKIQDADTFKKNLYAYAQFLLRHGGGGADTKDSTGEVIEQLIAHNRTYHTAIFNYRLWRTLLVKRDDLFAIFPAKKRVRLATRAALGLHGHYLTFFLI